jgi:branched-chain amino acid transport system substrate-binding protein
MIRKSLLALAAAFTVAGTSIYAQDIIKIGAIAPKTGPLAGGAVVTQWPNVQLWVEQVNARGGLNVDGKKCKSSSSNMMIKPIPVST